MASNCAKCGKPLKAFLIYIPGAGECCMECYREYAKNPETATKKAK